MLTGKSETDSEINIEPVILKTWDDVDEYFATHLIPVAHGPKGQPVYSHIDI